MIKVGIAGARGLANIMGFQDMEGVEVVALCDINETLLDRESKNGISRIPTGYSRIC